MKDFFNQLTKGGKIAIVVILIGIVYGGWYYATKNKLFDKAQKHAANDKFAVSEDADLVIAYNTFVGVEGLLYMNNGMIPTEDCRLFKEFGIKVQIKQIDISSDCKDGLKVGALDLIYCTVDASPIDMSSGSSLLELGVKNIMKVNQSIGADAIVAISTIKKVADLRGKKVAYALGTASNTLLISVLETAGLTINDITPYKVADGVEAANAFKSGQCDAAVVWAPDDEDCIAAVKNSSIIISTKIASQIIADGLLVSEKTLKEKRDKILKLCKAWLIGNAELNSNNQAKKQANALFAKGFNFPEEIAALSADKVRFSTLGDNKQFFGFDPTFTGVTGEKMYSRMCIKYTELGLAKAPAPWRNVSDASIIEELLNDKELVNVPIQSTESPVKFTAPTKQEETVAAKGSKGATLNFETNSAELDDEDKVIIDREVTGSAQGLAQAKIRIEGNTDNTGNPSLNKVLSKRRAQAVANYLVSEYKFDKNRFIIVGNGQDSPVSGCEDNASEDCKARNRRTDFEFIW